MRTNLRSFLQLILATTRTNFFRVGLGGHPPDQLAFKFDPAKISGLPPPRPQFEIWVYSPRTEGVHLRGGRSRGRHPLVGPTRRLPHRGPRPDEGANGQERGHRAGGAKGGFVGWTAPCGRDALAREVESCYRTFISGLLDLTDNLVGGEVRPPRGVVRYDGDDPYLVVAADKGTATFSDIANSISNEYEFWLETCSRPEGRRLRPQGDGHHCQARESVKHHFGISAPTSRPATSPSWASATCRVTCSVTACCCHGTSDWSAPSTTATCSSTRTPTRTPVSTSASACSGYRIRRG